MNLEGKGTPLSIWNISFLLFLLLNGAFLAYFYYNDSFEDKPYDYINLETLERISSTRSDYPDDKIVVVVGSSIVQYGLYCHDYYDTLNPKNGKNKIHVFKIHERGLQLDYFIHGLKLIDRLAAIKPDLVLFEKELAFFRRIESNSALPSWYHKYIHQIRSVKNRRLKKLKEADMLCVNPSTSNKADSTHFSVYHRLIRTQNEIDNYHAFLHKLDSNNVDIGLITFPRPAITRAKINALYNDIGQLDSGNMYLSRKFKILDSDLHLPWSHFADQGHMNRIGRKKFNEWLMNHLYNYWD